MTNYEWVKKRLMEEVNTPEKMMRSLLCDTPTGISALMDEVSERFCRPARTGCSTTDALQRDQTEDPCETCILNWLKEEKI